MMQNVIRDMGGIAAYGVISILLFFAVFTGAALYAFFQRNPFCERMRALPLDDGSRDLETRSADFQSAVSQVSNLPGAPASARAGFLTGTELSAPSRLEVGDTAGLETCATAKGASHE